MVHRVFRLSISPERAPEVRRVIDFDGRATLHDVHDEIQRALDLGNDHPYAFYLSGRYFDRSSMYSPDGDTRHDSTRSVLFRLGLNVGQQLAYVLDFGDELRHAITVVSVTEVDAPLADPVFVESVGEAPPQYDFEENDQEPYELPEHLTEVAPLAETVLDMSERLDGLYEADEAKHALMSDDDELDEDDEDDDEDEDEDEDLSEEDDGDATDEDAAGPPPAIVSLLRDLSKAALELAVALEEDEEALHELDAWSQDRELLPRLAELPLALVNVGELDSALAVARAFTFAAAESFNGDLAIIFAESGKRDEAMAQLEANLKQFPESGLTAIKSGAAFEALGDAVAAEASYRRAMALAEDELEEEEALGHLTGLLEDLGRFEDIDALLSASIDSKLLVRAKPLVEARPLPPVGRNEPCPCGSGKKYKKCHGSVSVPD